MNPWETKPPETPSESGHEPVSDAELAVSRLAAESAQGALPLGAGAELPEDLRVPWAWWDLLLFFLVGVASVAAWSMVVGQAAVALALVRGANPQELLQHPYTLIALSFLWFSTLFGYLFARIRLGKRLPFWRTIGWRALPPVGKWRAASYILWVLGGMVLGIIIQLASAAVRPKGPLPIEKFFQTRETVVLLMGMAILLAPLVEETIFRGYLYPVLARSLGVGAGVLVIGTAFGLSHAAQLRGGWWQVALLVVVGVVLTYVRAWTGSVTACYLLHLGYNSQLFLNFYVFTGGLRNLPGAE